MCNWAADSIYDIEDVMCKKCGDQEITVKFVIGSDMHHYKSFAVKCEHGSYTWDSENNNRFKMTFDNMEGECGANPLLHWLDFIGTVMFA